MKTSLTATSTPLPRKAWMGAGFVAASLLGSLAGQPGAAYQATFNLQVPDEPGTSRTFTFGGNSNLYTEMIVGSQSRLIGGTPVEVTTEDTPGSGPNGNGYGLCVISRTCQFNNDTETFVQSQAATFSFSRPVQLGLYNNFKVGDNRGPWSGFTGPNNDANYGLALFYNGIQQGGTISLGALAANTNFKFDSSLLVAANTAISVGLVCSGANCATRFGNQVFYISDVMVEVPAPLPLIGTSAAFAWTRRLRRRIKATPSPIMNG